MHLREGKDAWGKFDRDKWDLKFIDDSIAIELFDAMGSENLYKQAKRRNDLTYSGDLYANDYNGKIVLTIKLL